MSMEDGENISRIVVRDDQPWFAKAALAVEMAQPPGEVAVELDGDQGGVRMEALQKLASKCTGPRSIFDDHLRTRAVNPAANLPRTARTGGRQRPNIAVSHRRQEKVEMF